MSTAPELTREIPHGGEKVGHVDHNEEYDSKAIEEDGVDRHLAVEVPASLVGLSETEVEDLDKRITRKVDILVVPTLIILYVLNFLDRQNITTAKIGGVTKDLNMSTNDFATCVAVLFAGYISLGIPSNMIASRVSWPGVYICTWCAIWGTVSACTGAVQSYAGLVVCRLILGFTEAAFFPGALYLLTLFYTRKQIALRSALMYSGSQIGNAFGGLFALACLQLDGAHGLEGWRWLFIVEGSMTVGIALLFVMFIPNKPATIRWLTPVERDRLMYRLQLDKGTKDATSEMRMKTALYQVVTDPKTWFIGFLLMFAWVAAAVNNFFAVVVSSLGFNRTITLCITAPPYVLAIITISLAGWNSDRIKERTYHIVAAFSVCMLANIIALSTQNVAARYVAMMLMPSTFYSASIVALSWVSTTIVGPDIKRAIALALVNSFGNSANVWASYLYGGAPKYYLAFGVNLAASLMVILLALSLRWYLKRLNAKMDRGEDLGVHGPTRLQIEAGYRFML